jgi:hypothetical protein
MEEKFIREFGTGADVTPVAEQTGERLKKR